MESPAPPARSYLFAPASHVRRRERAFDCGADAVILDLEDAVAADEKTAARAAVAELLATPRPTPAWVRVNGTESPWCFADLEAVAGPGLAGVVLPKAERPDQLTSLDWVLGQLEHRAGLGPGTIGMMALVETAVGVERVGELARATPRLTRLGFGIADYSLDLGLDAGDDEAGIAYVRARLVHVSRAAGLPPPVDSVVVQVREAARFRDSAARARRLGLFGKLCIHPDQVPLANEIFAPTPAEVEWARAVVLAFEAAQRAGSAAIQVDGEFVDYPVVARARATLALAERLQIRAGA